MKSYNMKKKSFLGGLCAVVLVLCMGFGGCGRTVETDLTPKAPDRIPVESIEILNSEVTVTPGTYTLSGKVKPSAADQGINYMLQTPVDGVGITGNQLSVGLTAEDKAEVTVLAISTYDPSVSSRITFTLDVPVIEGTPIYTAEELRAIDTDDETRKGSYILMNDIDLAPEGYKEGDEWNAEYDWEPIGLAEVQSDENDQIIRPASPFNGIINGNGYTVKNMHISETKKQIEGNHMELWSRQLLGFIAQLGAGAELKNIKIQGEINGGSWCGGLVGVNGGGKISDCISDVKLTASKSVGALINNNRAGTIKNCIAIGKTTSTGSLNTDKHSAGLFVSLGNAENCFGDKEAMTTPNLATLNAPPTLSDTFMITTDKMLQRKTFASFDEDIWLLRDGHYPELRNAENGGDEAEAFVGFDMEQTSIDVKSDSEVQLVVTVSGIEDTTVKFGIEGNPAGISVNEDTGVLTLSDEAEDYSDLTVTATLAAEPSKTARCTFKIYNDEYDTNGHKINVGTEEMLYRLILEKSRFSYANVTLTADITLNKYAAMWPGIGDDTTPFTGTFNGNGHKISGINSSMPLFGTVLAPTRDTIAVSNLSVEGTVNRPGAAWIGGLVNKLKRGTVTDCFVDVDVTADYGLGGIAGISSEEEAPRQTVIKNCVYVGTLNANEGVIAGGPGWLTNVHPRAGGIAGANNATVANNYYDSDNVNAVPGGDDSEAYEVPSVMNTSDKTGAKTTEQLKAETAPADLGLDGWQKLPGEYPVPAAKTKTFMLRNKSAV